MSLESLDRAVNKTVDLSVGDIVAKYGSKDAIVMAVQKGEIADPTKAIMAGMAIDRIAASAIQPPQSTVAQDVFPPNQPQMGLAAAQQMPQQAPQMRGGQGLDQVPVPPQMFDEQRMAGGGIVAFQEGGGARNTQLIGTLESVLSQLKRRDPALNVDYVRRSVLSAPEDQQRALMQQLIESTGMQDQFAPAAASFTESLKTREVDPKVMRAAQLAGGLTPDEMTAPSPLTKEAAGLAAVAQRDATQADTGAQYGARPIPGSQILAQKADAAGNIYAGGVNPFTGAMDVARSGMQSFRDTFGPKAKMGDEGIIEPSATDFLGQGVPTPPQVDPFSATERFTGETVQTDPGFVPQDRTPSSEMLKKAAEEETKKAEEPKVRPGPTKEAAAGKKEEGPKSFDAYLKEITEGMGKSTVGAGMREEIEKDRKARKEDQQQAMWMSLVEAGLGIMGGESPYAFVNIGKGATNALKSYADRLREQKKLDREDRKILLDLERAERAELRDNYRLATESYNKALDRMNATERSEISARASMYAADKSVEAASMLRPGQAITSRAKVIEQVDAQLMVDKQYRDLKKTNPTAAQAYRQRLIDSRSTEVGLGGQMPGLNLGAWGQLTTVPGAR